MPLVYQQNINETAKIGVWHITESEDFFLEFVFPQKEINHPYKRLQHLAGRYLLKKISPDFPLDLIKVNASGKPYLENEICHFSISHSGDYVAVIISETVNVGIDIEKANQKIEKIKNKFSSIQELELFDNHAIDLIDSLTMIWSIKEALYKWYGVSMIDFKKHLCIERIQFNNNLIFTECIIKKNDDNSVSAVTMMIEGNVLTYVEKAI
jgi:phosphopantetheinyl transferase